MHKFEKSLQPLERIPVKIAPVNDMLDEMDSAIVNCLLYFEIFSHPLNLQELQHFLSIDNNGLATALTQLTQKGIIKKTTDCYYIHLQPAHVEQRKQAVQLFQKKLRTAKWFCRLIASFPFVRSVCLSGTMSKGVMQPDSDIDYFIITAPNRVWVAKMFLVLFKKIFLFNSYKYFCINYFIATDHLNIEEQNTFTATELATVMPIYGYEVYEKFIQQNQWVKAYYPNFIQRPKKGQVISLLYPFKKIVEFALNNRIGDAINERFRQMNWKRYIKMYGHLHQPEEMELMFKSKSYVSKNHKLNYQQMVTNKIEEKVVEFETTHQLKLKR